MPYYLHTPEIVQECKDSGNEKTGYLYKVERIKMTYAVKVYKCQSIQHGKSQSQTYI